MDFLETKYLYAILLLFTIAFPLGASFDRRFQYFRKWRFLYPGLVFMMIIFIPWDIWFTVQGVWWFNPDYFTGFTLFMLPLEEWLFFIIIPFACVFIYESLNYFFPKQPPKQLTNGFFFGYGSILVFLIFLYPNQLYTLIVSVSGLIGVVLLIWLSPVWAGRFLRMYLISLVPFLLINGALTGAFTQEATVNYNPEEFMGIRLFSIPVEDSIYNFSMLLSVVWIYELTGTKAGRKRI